MIQGRLVEENNIASRYGTGSWALFRGALYELSRKGMRNRIILVFCSFALQNMSGAAGKAFQIDGDVVSLQNVA